MEDQEILELYFSRRDEAIRETEKKYGGMCLQIANHILSCLEDAEECVNDAYLKAWNAIPPARPDRLGVWLGRVVRNTALNLWKKNHRKKRYTAGMEQLFSELEECIPSPASVDAALEEEELETLLNRWLAGLSGEDRILFLRRYWNCEALSRLEREYQMSHGKMAKKMYQLRRDLKAQLEKEGKVL